MAAKKPTPASVSEIDKQAAAREIHVSNYEQVASLLIALLVLVGTCVGMMLVLVMTMRTFKTEKAVPVSFVAMDEGYGRGDHEAGTARDEKNSQVEEFDEFFPPEMTEQIQSVTSVISTDMSMLENIDSQISTVGTGKGRGDSRPPGPLGEGTGDVVPRWERWQVRFASADMVAYAQQLDFFKIELAAIGGGKDSVDYASNLSQPNPTRRTGSSANEKRLYMTWRGGELIEADKSLLAKAGIDTVGRVVLQLYSPETEAMLAALEQKQLGMRQIKDIKRTVFGIRGKPGGYEFYVISQEYRYAS
jgi:hypothetical protein